MANYDVNYDDKRFTEVNSDKKVALSQNEQMYNNMINQADGYYQAQIQASKDWADKQTELQNEKTDFAIEQIEQQKDQTKQDYLKEQTGAYVDWQKESNRYGANAEEMAMGGLNNAGYGESAQVSMYNQYQNRVAIARESYNRAILNYDNAIKDAQLQNNSILAEIAYTSLQQQLELSLAGFQYKNQLLMAKSDKNMQIDQMYYGRWQDVLSQINTENAMKEQIRQYNQDYAFKQKQFEEEKRQFNLQLAESKRQYNGSRKGSSSGGGSGTVVGGSGNKTPYVMYPTSPSSIPEMKTYEQAAAYLRGSGVTKGDGGLMTKKEWLGRKSRGGTGSEMAYDSYEEYLNEYVEWALE